MDLEVMRLIDFIFNRIDFYLVDIVLVPKI